MPRRKRGWSDITVTDQFCGAGGSSIGAAAAGLRLRMALNHWKLAVETHNTNFPNADHDCCDISAADPRRYPSTDILITSPECTTHSPAGGNRKPTPQRDIFLPHSDDPAMERSRATMRDVPRFAEYHQYRRIIVENVVEVTRWPLFHHWLQEMQLLGYRWKLVSLNSMFCWPTPQSRDRLYIIFWKKGDKAPDMEIAPQAPCYQCEKVVNAVQTWKQGALKRALNGQAFGKYRTQYVYSCPTCRAELVPFYFAALNAIDFSLEAIRIGDRRGLGMPALKPRTIERIRYGLEKYGNRHLVVNVKQGERDSSRAWPADLRPIGTVPGWDGYFGLSSPFTMNTRGDGSAAERAHDVVGPMHAQTTRQEMGFVFNVAGRDSDASLLGAMPTQETREKFALCFLSLLRGTDKSQRGSWASGMDEVMGTVSAGGIHHALIGPGFAPFITMRRGGDHARGLSEEVPTVTAQDTQHLLIQGAAQISLRDANAMRVAGLDAEMMAQGCAPQQAIIQRAPFLTTLAFVQQAQGSQAHGLDEPVPTVKTCDRDAVVTPGKKLRVEDCYFRMLQPHEIGRAMAFPNTYTVLGNKRERVKQYGNAVTPPAMATLITRQVQALTGERYE